MSEVKRYDIDPDGYLHEELMALPSGRYVLASDYDTLKAERDAQRVELAKMKDSCALAAKDAVQYQDERSRYRAALEQVQNIMDSTDSQDVAAHFTFNRAEDVIDAALRGLT